MDFLKYRENVYSQNGEDGILREVFRRIGFGSRGSRWAVEFGAWDGKHLSNTFNLVKESEFRAIYIESDQKKFRSLEKVALEEPEITAIHAEVGHRPYVAHHFEAVGITFEGFEVKNSQTLDEILNGSPLPQVYDVLSIDIDSFDLAVWESHKRFRPRVVVIEIHSGIEPGILQWHGNGASGNSFSSTVAVGLSKGYVLVAHTGNLVFLCEEEISKLGIPIEDFSFPERFFLRDYMGEKSSDSPPNRYKKWWKK
jgi:hypothetical protein